MINIVFLGYDGKMGSKVLSYLEKEDNIKIIDKINKESFNIKNRIKVADVIVDFTCKSFAYEIALFCANNKIPFVSGTTGFTKKELDIINKEFTKNKIGCIICPNYSKGIRLIYNLLDELSSSYDKIEIEETHHISKIDMPSGTANLLKEKINKNINIISKRKCHYNAIHKLSFTNNNEELIIIHKVKNKNAYGYEIKKSIENINTFIGLKTFI